MLERGNKVTLMDVETEDDSVVKAYYDWIGPFVEEYGIGGLRINAAWHIRADCWQLFAGAAGVFCVGEVFGNDPAATSEWQGPLDSILNFPLGKGILDEFTIPGPRNISALETIMKTNWILFKILDCWETSWRTRMPRIESAS